MAITSPDPSASAPVYALAIFYAKAPGNKIIWVPNGFPGSLRANASITLSELGDLAVYDNSGEGTKLVWSLGTGGVSMLHIPLCLHS